MQKTKEGIILLNKPKGITSHDAVDIVRKRLGIRKVGHAGTLDPLAEGLLVILVGKATKLFSRFVDFDKEYIGILKLGEVTTTGDSQGQIIRTESIESISESRVREVFSKFEGELEQVPPMVSALRVGGQRLYKLARKGVVIDRKPRKIKIHNLEISRIEFPFVEFCIHCSKGTYIRKLAEDIGQLLGCGSHMTKIERLSIGPFELKDAVNLDQINESHLRKFTSQ